MVKRLSAMKQAVRVMTVIRMEVQFGPSVSRG